MSADFSGAVRIYVNSDMPGISDRFTDGDLPTLQAILGDVRVQMASTVIDQPELLDDLDHCPEGSVGRQILDWLDMAFPGQSPATLRGMRLSAPGRFSAALVAAARLED